MHNDQPVPKPIAASGEDIEFPFLLNKNGYKLVFAENAICYHKHPDTILKYLQIKFSRGYWRTLLYKNYKNKSIAIIGHMGSGKSIIGKLIAKNLNFGIG